MTTSDDRMLLGTGTLPAPAVQRRSHALAKRGMDCLGASLFLALLLPVIVMVALAVRCSSRGPVFFRHTRVGLQGRPFRVWKFRTMHTGVTLSEAERQTFSTKFKLDGDPRVTTVGRVLRKTSLDELPQLINVLLGHMALVGPRPVTTEEIEHRYGDLAPILLSVKPGMTGLWQVAGRSSLPYEARVALDIHYARAWSLWLDLAILARTVPAVLFMRGAE